MVRLQKYLAQCGVASRRKCEALIEAGHVLVNGQPASLGASVDPETDTVTVDGEAVSLDRNIYVVLNKPKDVVTTAKDPQGRKTVLDCVTGVTSRIYPVGRLDIDVEGVLLLTNDGELAHRLTHPSFEIEKVYMAWVEGRVLPEAVEHLEKGVPLEDGVTAPAKAQVIRENEGKTLVRLTIHEGKKREVKRMCAAVGHPVACLRRVRIGDVGLDELRSGEWRYLRPDEVQRLKSLAGLSANQATS